MKIKSFLQIEGAADTGKTSAITWTFLKLLEEGATLKGFKYVERGDFVALIEFKQKILAIISRGDVLECCEEDIKALQELASKNQITDLDLLIYATRTKGKTIEFYQKLLEQNSKQEADKVIALKEWFSPENKGKIIPYLDKQVEKIYQTMKTLLGIS